MVCSRALLAPSPDPTAASLSQFGRTPPQVASVARGDVTRDWCQVWRGEEVWFDGRIDVSTFWMALRVRGIVEGGGGGDNNVRALSQQC